ncbi:MAG TPA: response regulator, partial [Spirochaetales bacterium]|nr:response regulator [Spirochaetales bacterium]
MAFPEAVFRASFEQSSQPLAVVDGAGLLAIWNGAFEAFFSGLAGVGPARLKTSLLDFLEERESLRFDYYAAELLLGGRDSALVETPVRAADGTRHWLRVGLSLLEMAPKPGAEARPERFLLCSLEDVTDRVAREQRLRDEKEEAEKATHTKSQFLANMSHEIRTPIQTILGVVELLQETGLDGEQAEYASQVRFSADILLGLINDILDFSKIEADKLDLETIDFDLRACVQQSVDLLVMEAHRKGLEVIVDVDEELPGLVRGDPARIRQIIVNLFKNAVKFTRDGCISLRLRKTAGSRGPFVRFEVADTGIGIPEDVRLRLFTPFFQADFAAARKAGGTGLGLAISRRLSELMGGSIGVLPNEPRGSVFWFELPLASPEFSAPPAAPPAAPDARLLIVDDYSDAREFAARTASRAGYRTATAASGEEALAALRGAAKAQDPFALCLIDQNMPVMDGWRLASEITGDISINGARLILMVPEGTMGGDAKMKLLRWFNAYVPKPLRPADLLETLRRALSSDVDLESADAAEEAGAAGAAGAPEDGQAEPEPSFEASVLLAEDHEVNRELFTLILGRLGCRVVAARDGVEAVEIGSSRGFDIVLMDIFMPRMNGYEASLSLRERGYRGPIIAVTASALKGEREKCVEAGMDDILVKPFKKHDLATVLSAWLPSRLGGSRAEAEGQAAAPFRSAAASPSSALAAPSSPGAAAKPAAGTAAASVANAGAAAKPAAPPRPAAEGIPWAAEEAAPSDRTSGPSLLAEARRRAEGLKAGAAQAAAAPGAAPAGTPAAPRARGQARQDQAAQGSGAALPDAGVFDWEGVIDTFLGQKETVVNLLRKFADMASRQVEELGAALEAKDFPRFREVAHSLKGASWNLSARALGDAALAAEDAGKRGDAEAAKAARAALGPALGAFLAAIKPYT